MRWTSAQEAAFDWMDEVGYCEDPRAHDAQDKKCLLCAQKRAKLRAQHQPKKAYKGQDKQAEGELW